MHVCRNLFHGCLSCITAELLLALPSLQAGIASREFETGFNKVSKNSVLSAWCCSSALPEAAAGVCSLLLPCALQELKGCSSRQWSGGGAATAALSEAELKETLTQLPVQVGQTRGSWAAAEPSLSDG